MKHLVQFERYSPSERVDDILDKINKYGISSISDDEKRFLDAHSKGNSSDIHKELLRKDVETIFKDEPFKFELETVEIDDTEQINYIGTLYLPDIKVRGKVIPGIIKGKIISDGEGLVFGDFEMNKLNLYDFAEGLEYELDSFMDYVASELDKNLNYLI